MRIQKRIEVKVISSKVLPQKFRSKLKDRPYLDVGPKMDQFVAAAIKQGHLGKLIARAGKELTALSRKEGWLSNDQLNRSKQMQDKLAGVQKYLAAYDDTRA